MPNRTNPVVPSSFFLLLSIVLCTACSSEKEKPAPPPPGVTVATAVSKNVPLSQEWVGTTVGNVDAEIRPKVDGFLLTRVYTEGSFVKKGHTMFQLEPRQSQAAVEEAEAQVAQARALLGQAQIDIARYTPLVAEKAVSQAELDRAKSLERSATAQIEAAQAQLNNAKLNRGWTTVASPISGIAGIAKVGIGDLMTPTSVMTTVSAVDPIYVDFQVAEQDYLRLARERTAARAAGRNLQLTLGDGSIFPHPGHVIVIGREVDSRTGTIQIRAEFPNPGNLLRPGQYARIRAVTENLTNALLIPQRSVSELQGVYQVGVVDSENKVAIRAVKLGPQFGDMWVVNSGIKPGDKVVVDGLQRLRDGMTVTPTPFVDTQANAVKGGE